MDESSFTDLAKTMPLFKNVTHTVSIMTVNFLQDVHCKRLFMLLKKELNKNVYLILLDRNFAWKKDPDVGLLCSDDVRILFFF